MLLVVFATSCKSASSAVSNSKNSKIANELVNDASDNIGSPYKYGGTTKNGFDCSGLVFVTFKKNDISLPRTSFDMSKYGKVISKKDAQKGDLIFFKTNGSSKINHVGLIVDIDKEFIKFIHASIQKGVIISSTKEDYYRKSFSQINRVID